MSKEAMTPEMMRKVQMHSELGAYAAANLVGAYDIFQEFWRVAMSAAPQPEQAPVAWGVFDGPNLHDMFFTEEDAQEMVRLKGDGSTVKPLYTTPPAAAQRPWVSLTPKEVKEISFANRPYVVDMVVALEAKLKEKNA